MKFALSANRVQAPNDGLVRVIRSLENYSIRRQSDKNEEAFARKMKRRKLQNKLDEIFLEPWASGECIERVRVLAEMPPPRREGFRELISVGQLANSNGSEFRK